jgi:hypothetical protein
VDYKDDPAWKQWRKATLQKVFLKDDDDHDAGTRVTTGSEERRDVVHKTKQKCRMASAASAASTSTSQKSGRTGSSSSCQTYRTPASSQSSGAPQVMTPYVYGVCRGHTNKSGGEMTQEQKAKAYDAFMRGNNQSQNGLGCVVLNHHRTGKTPPPLPEEIVVPGKIESSEVEEDDGSSTLVCIRSCVTQHANLF